MTVALYFLLFEKQTFMLYYQRNSLEILLYAYVHHMVNSTFYDTLGYAKLYRFVLEIRFCRVFRHLHESSGKLAVCTPLQLVFLCESMKIDRLFFLSGVRSRPCNEVRCLFWSGYQNFWCVYCCWYFVQSSESIAGVCYSCVICIVHLIPFFVW